MDLWAGRDELHGEQRDSPPYTSAESRAEAGCSQEGPDCQIQPHPKLKF